MRIAIYNILKGGPQRVHWVKMIEDHGVDLLGERQFFNYLPRACFGFMRISYLGKSAERSSLALMIFISAL